MPDIVHLLNRSSRLAVIACGTAVSSPSQYTTETKGPRAASCKRCAKYAPGLTEDQRVDIWQNANDRLHMRSDSPWEKKRAKAARAKAREEKRAVEAAARALPCPRCGAESGQGCRWRNGSARRKVHAVRHPISSEERALATIASSTPASDVVPVKRIAAALF